MRRLFAILALACAVYVTFFWRESWAGWGFGAPIIFHDLMPGLKRSGLNRQFGPLRLDGAWQITSRDFGIGNFSGLAETADHHLVSQSDRNALVSFTRPDRPGPLLIRRYTPVRYDWLHPVKDTDAESISINPTTQQILIGYEGIPRYHLFSPDLKIDRPIRAPVLNEWPENQGPEAMRQLADGRTIVIGEVFADWLARRAHPGLIYPGLPRDNEKPQRFTLMMPEGFRPTELAQLPDGRLWLLGRTLTLNGFRTVIVETTPQAIRPGAVVEPRLVTRIADRRIRDNYEGMVATREADGGTAIWIISDSNEMSWFQRTLFLKFRLTQ